LSTGGGSRRTKEILSHDFSYIPSHDLTRMGTNNTPKGYNSRHDGSSSIINNRKFNHNKKNQSGNLLNEE
jgi:hypothetical protein